MTNTAKPKSARRFSRMPKPDTSVGGGSDAGGSNGPAPTLAEPLKAKAENKISRVIALLQRPEGATLDEMVAATGWLPHTMRAALTGLRKKGHAITRDKRDNMTWYRIAAAA